jgi:hypothetical protein
MRSFVPHSFQDPSVAESTSHIFLSYASLDRERVQPVVAALDAAGVRVWFDRTGIAAGESYGPEIVAALRSSAALVLCCSAAAFSSRNVRQELALAWKHEVPVLPLLLEPAAQPDEVAYWLEGCQWIELLDHPVGEWLPEVLRALGRPGVAVASPAASPPVASSLGTWAPSGCRPN